MGKKKKKKGEQDNEKISVKCVSGNKLLTLLQVGQSKSHKFTSVPSLTVNWNLLPPSMIYGYLCRACENDPVFVAMMIFKCFAGMRRRRRPTHTVYILYMYTHTHSHKSAASCAMKSDTLAPLSAVNPPTPRKRRATEADRHLISQRSATVCRERNGGSLSPRWRGGDGRALRERGRGRTVTQFNFGRQMSPEMSGRWRAKTFERGSAETGANQASAGDSGRQGGAATEQSTHSAVRSRGWDGALLKCMRCIV